MSAIEFGTTIDLLKNAMTGASAANGAFARNMANVNTPNYHRNDVSFKSELMQAAGMGSGTDELTLRADNPRDVNASTGEFEVSVSTDDVSKMRQDGNNVDVDQEMARLSMNADYGSMGANFLRNQYAMLRNVIQE